MYDDINIISTIVRRRLSPTVRATKLSFFQPRVSRYILNMSLSLPPLGRAAPSYFRSRGEKPVSCMRDCHREGRGEVTTNYSGERDSDEMKRGDLAPFSLFLHFSQFALNLCPPFFPGRKSRSRRCHRMQGRNFCVRPSCFLLISGAEEPTIYLLKAFTPLTLSAMGLDR